MLYRKDRPELLLYRRNTNFGHKISLSPEEQKRFLYFIHKLSENEGYGQDILDHAVFLQLMTFLNGNFFAKLRP